MKRTDWEFKLSAALWAYRTSYKVATGCTPFKLVYGLEAVMPWEFLVPSLRIAVAEHWDGHELYDRIRNLELLDEERHIALQGMIVEKQRRKQWYDRQLKEKNINVGDMVLLFGVRDKKRKLKYTGMGPYRICKITPQGTVRVETLDGIETVGFLNGSKFKRYYDPLTIETIEMAREKQAAKEKELKRIQAAIKEGKEREARNKQKRQANVWTYNVFLDNIDEINEPAPLRTPIELNGRSSKVLYNALIDTGLSHNLLSFEAWNQLGRPALTLSSVKVRGVNGQTSYVVGIFNSTIKCANGHMESSFLVMPAGELFENVILGRTWMCATNCQLDWVTQTVNMVIPNCPKNTHCTHCSPNYFPTSTSMGGSTTQLTPSQLTANITHPLRTSNNCPLQKHKNRSSTPKTLWKWVPKRRTSKPLRQTTGKPKGPKPHQQWVPRALLINQGYNEGSIQIWIPKNRPFPQLKSLKPRQPPYAGQGILNNIAPSSSTLYTNNPTRTHKYRFEKGECSRATNDYEADENLVLIFPPPNLPSPTTKPLPHKNKASQLSQAADLLKRHLQAPGWWINRFSGSPTLENKPSEVCQDHHLDNHITVGAAEVQEEEDFLTSFQYWIPYEEEKAKYERIFFQQFWPNLPRDIMAIVRVKYAIICYQQCHPFGIYNAPASFQRYFEHHRRQQQERIRKERR